MPGAEGTQRCAAEEADRVALAGTARNEDRQRCAGRSVADDDRRVDDATLS